ncbi:amidase signature domain-containing protein, partial [Thelonectria olida]
MPAEVMELWRCTASQALARIQSDDLSVTAYAQSLLDRIRRRDDAVRAWVHLDVKKIVEQAHTLDDLPHDRRGPLHGLPIAVKDVIDTKDMPTQHNSPLYEGSFPAADAGSVRILRQAGALIFGKTTTTEFAAIHIGPKTRNPHDQTRTPGGSSAGSGAAVGDFQVPIALGTQTGGSTIRPASFNGIYGFKPTWNAISREGQKIYALVLDTLGLYARCVDDLVLLTEVFGFEDDEEDATPFDGIEGARFAICKTNVWHHAGKGTQDAMSRAAALLQAHGAIVEDIDLGADFAKLEEWHHIVLHAEGRTNFLPEYRVDKTALHPLLVDHVENIDNISRKKQLEAFDGISALRPRMDAIAKRYAAIITPSVPDEAPVGLRSTGSHVFCSMWSALHSPVLNVPGFKGADGMPIGLSLVAPRYRDRHLLKVGKAVGEIFETEGGWKQQI